LVLQSGNLKHNSLHLLPFCSNLAWVTDIGIVPPGRKGVPSKICIAKSTEGSYHTKLAYTLRYESCQFRVASTVTQ
jgi:hypothetical protein